MHGRLRLRSFHEILTFIGRGMEEEPEFDVPPDPRTPAVGENPTHTLEIIELGIRRPSRTVGGVARELLQRAPQSGYQWNMKAFSLLYQLFQMSVSTAEQSGPVITISK